jgi:hypothetical protein
MKNGVLQKSMLRIFFSLPLHLTLYPYIFLNIPILPLFYYTIFYLFYIFSDFFGECCTPLQTHCSDKLLYFFGLLNLPKHFSKISNLYNFKNYLKKNYRNTWKKYLDV